MAADTGKKNNLALHLDKIAYGAAGVLALIIVLLPKFATSDLKTVESDLASLQEKVKVEQEKPPTPPSIPRLKDTLEKEWAAPSSLQGPWVSPWTVEARPAVVKLTVSAGPVLAVHEAGKVIRITPLRDPARRQVYLKVEAEWGKVESAARARARIVRAEIPKPGEVPAEAKFAEVADLPPGPIAFNDYGVAPGKLYAYKLVTEVAPAPGDKAAEKNVQLKPEDKLKESEPLPMNKVVPYEYAVRILVATPFNPQTGAEASLNGEVSYWDYEQKKVVSINKVDWKEKQTFGPKVNGQDRYKILRIEDGKVIVQDVSLPNRPQDPLTSKDNRRPVELPNPFILEALAPEGAGLAEAAAKLKAPEGKKDASKAEEGAAPKGPKKAEAVEPKAPKKPAAPSGKDTKKDTTKKDTKKATKRPGIK